MAEVRERIVIVTIDCIVRLIKDYAGQALELPDTAQITKFRLTPDKKLEMMLEDDSWVSNRPAEQVRFDMKRVYAGS